MLAGPSGFGTPVCVWHNKSRVLSCGPSPSRACPPSNRRRVPLALAACSSVNIPGAPTHVATKIKLMRLGKMRAPYYRIVVADARTKRDGRSIEMIGKYHPKEDPSFIEVDSERVQYWLGVGAQPTEAVAAILRVTGDWQQFTGQPAPEPMKVRAPKADKRALFEAATEHGTEQATGEATTPKKRAARPAKAAADKTADKTADKAADKTAAGTPADGPTADQASATAAAEGKTLTEKRAAGAAEPVGD